MKKRRKFKAHEDNPLKQYRRRFTDYQVMVRAEIARQARLRDRQTSELAFEEILKEIGVEYEVEKIFQNGDRWILVDFLVGDIFAFEIDGAQHNLQIEYDAGRSQWLARKGITTIRFTNLEVTKTPQLVSDKLKEILANGLSGLHI